jgi:hypothetical protein
MKHLLTIVANTGDINHCRGGRHVEDALATELLTKDILARNGDIK